MKWVLIVVLFNIGTTDEAKYPVSMATATFADLQSCTVAGQKFRALARSSATPRSPTSGYVPVKFECVPGGE